MGKRLVQQARGRGSPTYRNPSFRSVGQPRHASIQSKGLTGEIVDIVNCSQHSAPLAKVQYSDGKIDYILAAEGISVGEVIKVGSKDVEVGNCMRLKDIPVGTLISNIELAPGDGGKICRASGTFARVTSRLKKGVLVTLPSKKQKLIMEECRASIGMTAGGGRLEKPILRAGNMFYKKKARNKLWPITSGHAQNAVDHPFGNKRSSRKAKNVAVGRNAPPGRKVGMLYPRRTGSKK
jgi:large subunit ribosomal protein L2